MKSIKISICLLAGILVLQGCSKKEKNEGSEGESGKNETNISARNTSRSHHMGENCMGCHKSGGKGEGWFNIAGTVYDEKKQNTYPNAVIKLYTGKNGTGDLKYTIEGDLYGNFFTTANIDFGSGLYPTVEGANGKQHMQSIATTGQCNSCHTSDKRIWTN